MAKVKKPAAKKKPTLKKKKVVKAPYLTAKQLDITIPEYRGLVAFVKSRFNDEKKTISLNGVKHYYDQSYIESREDAEEHNCKTAGCVAGYVYAHARFIQKKRDVLGRKSAESYYSFAARNFGVLRDLYTEYSHYNVSETKRVVEHLLRTGEVDWHKAVTA